MSYCILNDIKTDLSHKISIQRREYYLTADGTQTRITEFEKIRLRSCYKTYSAEQVQRMWIVKEGNRSSRYTFDLQI